jgi:hypothetical protein
MSHAAGERHRIQAENMIKKGDYLIVKTTVARCR